MFTKHNRIFLYKLLTAITIFSLFIFYQIASGYQFSSVERKLFTTLGILPFVLWSGIMILKPAIVLEAFKAFKSKDNLHNIKMQRFSGTVFLLLALMNMMRTWI